MDAADHPVPPGTLLQVRRGRYPYVWCRRQVVLSECRYPVATGPTVTIVNKQGPTQANTHVPCMHCSGTADNQECTCPGPHRTQQRRPQCSQPLELVYHSSFRLMQHCNMLTDTTAFLHMTIDAPNLPQQHGTGMPHVKPTPPVRHVPYRLQWYYGPPYRITTVQRQKQCSTAPAAGSVSHPACTPKGWISQIEQLRRVS